MLSPVVKRFKVPLNEYNRDFSAQFFGDSKGAGQPSWSLAEGFQREPIERVPFGGLLYPVSSPDRRNRAAGGKITSNSNISKEGQWRVPQVRELSVLCDLMCHICIRDNR